MQKLFILFFVLIFPLILNAQYEKSVTNVATTAAPFLEIGVGSRAVGMGGAYVATANDASAMYWNPAGLGRLEKIEMIFVHTNWLADITFDYAGAVLPVTGIGTFGLNITLLDIGEMKVRTVERQEGTGEYFEAKDFALGFSYGVNLTSRFSIGFNAKYILQRIWHEQAQGYAIDIGTIYNTPFEGLRIGAALSNFGSDMQMSGNDLLVYHDLNLESLGNNERIFAQLQTESWPLPLNFQFGLAMDLFNSEIHNILIAADAVHPIDNSESIHLGMEYAILNNYFLRAGYRNLFLKNSEEGVTLGAGINVALFGNFGVNLDYAYADFGRLENVQRFSINIRL